MTREDEDIAQVLANGWAVRFLLVGPYKVAYAAVKGHEVHFKALDPRQAIQRNRLRAFVRELEQEFGYLTTRVEVGDEANQRFVRLMGFTDTWQDDTYRYFCMTALPFERG